MAGKFTHIPLDRIIVGEPLPVPIYIYLDFRFILYRAKGDIFDRKTYDRLEQRQTQNLYVLETDHPLLEEWWNKLFHAAPSLKFDSQEALKLKEARLDVHRKTLDIFNSQHPDQMVTQAIQASQKLVDEVMELPLAAQSIRHLQTYSTGTVSHSINVSILSIYLAIQMGYAHKTILQNISLGALLHDIGKSKVPLSDGDDPHTIEIKMKEHPTFSLRMLESQSEPVHTEVKMIVAQHHEAFDGSGYPKKMRGKSIYDLARLVSIANTFDGLVGNGTGPLIERQKSAILHLEQILYDKFDPEKLEKALKILKFGI